MTAMTRERATRRYSNDTVAAYLTDIPVKAATKILAGAVVATEYTGNAVNGSASAALRVVGVAERTVDNTDGSSGDLKVRVRRGAHHMANNAGAEAVTAADVGSDCYLLDNQTVSRSDGAGARPIAGKVLGFEGSEVIVEIGVSAGERDETFIAGADLSAKRFFAVKGGTGAGEVVLAGAGEPVIGILQNAPTAGQVARVRTSGRTRAISGGVIALHSQVASDAAGKAKAAVTGRTDTSDAGASNDALAGSYVWGIALGVGAADGEIAALITHAGAVPQNAS